MYEHSFLTLPRLLRGSFYDLVGSVSRSVAAEKRCPAKIGKYVLEESFHETAFSSLATGRYVGPAGETVVIRHLDYTRKNTTYQSMLHEASILSHLQGFSCKSGTNRLIRLPRAIALEKKPKEVVFIKEFVDGKTLSRFPEDIQLQVFQECLRFLECVTERFPASSFDRLPRRSNTLLCCVFPIYLFMAILRGLLSVREATSLARLFLIAVFSGSFLRTRYVLSHCDLHPDNIIVNDDEIVIIDNEALLLSDRHTDIGKAMRSYQSSVPLERICVFLKERLSTRKDRQKFSALSAYYMVQLLATCPKEKSYFTETREYLEVFLSEIVPRLLV